MNVINLKRRVLMVLAFITSLCCIGFAVKTFEAKATDVTPKTLEEVNITMKDGAAVRMLGDGNNGIMFGMVMNSDDYLGLKANTNYAALQFGVVIAPADYLGTYGVFSKETLFTNPIYDWAEWDGSKWVYTPDTGNPKTRIVCFTVDSMEEEKDGSYILKRSVTNILGTNIARDFVGCGFVGVSTDGESFDYKIANYFDSNVANNTCSMALVAARAVASGDYDQTEEEWLTTNYLENETAVIDNTASNAGTYKNYEEKSNFVVTGLADLGATSRLTDANGVELNYKQSGTTLTVDGNDDAVMPSGDQVLHIYSKIDSAYKLVKVTVTFDVRTVIRTLEKLNVARSTAKGNFILMTDLTLTEALPDPEASFGGTFDGNGHVIENMVLSSSNAGLFSTLSGTVKNLGFKNVTYSGTNIQTGAVAKRLSSGTVDNVYIEYSDVNSYYSGGVVQQVGGDSAITNSTVYCSSATMAANKNNGLLVGFNSSEKNVATLDLTGTRAIKRDANATIVGARNDTEARTEFRDNVNGTDTALTPKSVSLADYDFENYAYDKGLLFSALSNCFYKISNSDELLAIRTITASNRYYVLTDDIDLSDVTLGSANANFSGVLDGNGHKISNMTLDNNNTSVAYAGFFRSLYGTLKNIAFVNAKINVAGAFIASEIRAGATLNNVYVKGNLMNKGNSGAVARNLNTTNLSEDLPIKVINCIFNPRNIVATSGVLFGVARIPEDKCSASYFDMSGTYLANTTSVGVVGNDTNSATFKTYINSTYADYFKTAAQISSGINGDSISVRYKALALSVLS